MRAKTSRRPTMPLLPPMLLWTAVVFGLHGFSVTAAATSLDVSLKIGSFRGVSTANGTEKWLGIPFAESPVGPLRFKAPVPIAKAFKGINNASSFGNACPQPPGDLGATVAEDCLFLNVRRGKFRMYLLMRTARRFGDRRAHK